VNDRVTVVVMTRDRWPDLRTTLPRHAGPVVVVDNGSRDGTPALVREHFPSVDVVELGENRGSPARNTGVERARTPYVAFADDDSWWDPGSLDRAAALLDAHPRLALLAARLVVGDEARPDPVSAAMRASPLGVEGDLPGPSVLGFLACAAVVRRTAFLDVGGFDDVLFFMGEEERVALDLAGAGWGLAYVDDVVAHHHPSSARDSGARAARERRNELLTAMMRRPWGVVLREIAAALRTSQGRRAVLEAAGSAPAALGRRRVVPSAVEVARRLLDDTGHADGHPVE
jgi:GT2 family glycosyltransferase